MSIGPSSSGHPVIWSSDHPDLAAARAVIAQEIAGLKALDAISGETFLNIIELVDKLKGRIIVTGMGKSGHVARKIAATLASTGTPAIYVHPAEAGHGDLGMITKDDALLALSNSGETPELGPLIAYARRFAIPLIAMVRKSPSLLTEAANYSLVLPDVPEASPVGAPTTSTTMMMALGDALAMVLLNRKGFTKEQFATFHPGGNIGQGLRKVSELMHTGEELPLAALNTPMHEILLLMTSRRFGCAGIVGEDEKLVGIITDGDLRRHMMPDLMNKQAEEVMTKNPVAIGPNAFAADALALMNMKSITTLFAVEQARPVGILHLHDLLRAGVV